MERHEFFENFQTIIPRDAIASFIEWKSSQLNTVLRSVTAFTLADVEAVLGFVLIVKRETYFNQ